MRGALENKWMNMVLSAALASEERVKRYRAADHLNNMTALVIYKTFPEVESEVSNSSQARQRENEANYSYSDVRKIGGHKKQRTSSSAFTSGMSQSSYQDDRDDLRHSIRNTTGNKA